MERTRVNSLTALTCSLHPLIIFSKNGNSQSRKDETKKAKKQRGRHCSSEGNKQAIQHSDQLTVQNIFILARH